MTWLRGKAGWDGLACQAPWPLCLDKDGIHCGCGPSSPSLVCPSDTASSPNTNLFLGCGWFSPRQRLDMETETLVWVRFPSCLLGSPQRSPPCGHSTHRSRHPLHPPGPHQRRGWIQAAGLQTKPGSCCWSGIAGEGTISTTINASDYLIRGKMRSPGGGPHTQKRNNSCPCWQ